MSIEGPVLLYGAGREAVSTRAFLKARYPDLPVFVTADGGPAEIAETTFIAPEGLDPSRFGLIVKSPGVPPGRPLVAAARAAGVPVTSNLNLWAAHYREGRTVLAITGTKGKSTTSALLAHLLASHGLDVALAGNIGRPLMDLDRPAADHDVVVVELSSYQLSDLDHPLPVGVWLNLHREHLDWHGTHAAYAADKARIVSLSRVLVANGSDPAVRDAVGIAVAGRDDRDAWQPTWVDTAGDPLVLGDGLRLARGAVEQALAPSALVGGHHVANVAMALAAAATIGVAAEELLAHIATFTPLPHRLELVHDDGRRWVDDSISTIPEAAVAALAAFPGTPVTLIAGGFDRGQDHAGLVEAIVAHGAVTLVVLPDTGARLQAAIDGAVPVEPATDLADAVAIAHERTPAGGVVLLSPAAPSYGQFTSFEDRGNQFAALAREPR